MKDQSIPVGTDQTEMAVEASGRRRLVRGAVALAPVVLTLRSGALAAASCTAAIAFGTVDKNGHIGDIVNADSGRKAQAGDICVTGYSQNQCLAGSSRISSGTPDPLTSPITGPNLQSLKCGSATSPYPNQSVQVAILSSAAVTSLRG